MERLINSGIYKDLDMRPGFGSFMQPFEERLRFIKQLGVDDLLLNMYRNELIDTNYGTLPLPGEKKWEYSDLKNLKDHIEAHELRLQAIENMPFHFYDKLMMGEKGREEQLENVKEIIHNMGQAGIPVLGYAWTPSGVWRSSTTYKIRGGAEAMNVDLSDFTDAPLTHGREYSENEMWDNYEYFIESVIPVAEESGVTLALHPNDPPTPVLGGVPQLFRSFEAFKKAMSMVESENHGLQFCLGSWSEMGEDLDEVIDYFGPLGKFVYVHFQVVSGPVPKFHEIFIDQKGYYDPLHILKKLHNVGFRGMIMPGHVPKVEGDGPWKERSRAFTIGYIKGLLYSMGIQ
jgi:mannonate dehydratase